MEPEKIEPGATTAEALGLPAELNLLQTEPLTENENDNTEFEVHSDSKMEKHDGDDELATLEEADDD